MTTNIFSNLREAVAVWHERMHADHISDETRRAFTEWLEESPANRGAYSAFDEACAALRSAAETSPILALRHEAALRATRHTSRTLRPLRAVAVVLAIVAVGTIVFAGLSPSVLPRPLTGWMQFWLPGNSVYATGTGERISATLRDGSQVTLDTQSELEVAFTRTQRTVRLKRGQAFFDVSKDKDRPFVVEANNRRLVAVGTAFDVRLDGSQIRVTMVEGVVRVERFAPNSGGGPGRRTGDQPMLPSVHPSAHSLDNPTEPYKASLASTPATSRSPGQATTGTGGESILPADATVISAGEQLLVDRDSEDYVRAADPERVTSWRRGEVIFDGARLADAITELNRYCEAQIQLNDPTLAGARISGTFATGRIQGFLEAITSYFPIEVTESNDRVVILNRRH